MIPILICGVHWRVTYCARPLMIIPCSVMKLENLFDISIPVPPLKLSVFALNAASFQRDTPLLNSICLACFMHSAKAEIPNHVDYNGCKQPSNQSPPMLRAHVSHDDSDPPIVLSTRLATPSQASWLQETTCWISETCARSLSCRPNIQMLPSGFAEHFPRI